RFSWSGGRIWRALGRLSARSSDPMRNPWPPPLFRAALHESRVLSQYARRRTDYAPVAHHRTRAGRRLCLDGARSGARGVRARESDPEPAAALVRGGSLLASL